MAEPSDSAARRAGLRASDADRDQAIERLKAAFVLGMLDKDEMDVRVGLVLVSATRAGLDALTSDIPDHVAATAPPAGGGAQPNQNSSAKVGAAIIGTSALAAVVASADFGAPVLAAAIIFCVLIGGVAALAVAALVRTILLVEGRAARRDGGQLPPSSGGGGGGFQRAVPAVRPGPRRRGQPRRPSSLAISMR